MLLVKQPTQKSGQYSLYVGFWQDITASMLGIPTPNWINFVCGYDDVRNNLFLRNGWTLMGRELHQWILDTGIPHFCNEQKV